MMMETLEGMMSTMTTMIWMTECNSLCHGGGGGGNREGKPTDQQSIQRIRMSSGERNPICRERESV